VLPPRISCRSHRCHSRRCRSDCQSGTPRTFFEHRELSLELRGRRRDPTEITDSVADVEASGDYLDEFTHKETTVPVLIAPRSPGP
jgi:hypothetical protein